MIIDGRLVANKIKEELKSEIEKNNIKPGLAVISIGEDEASKVYVEQKEKLAKELSIHFEHLNFIDENESVIETKIIELNKNKLINGIIIQLPIPSIYNKDHLLNLIDSSKDVDGLTDKNKTNLINNKHAFIPCTPKGILELFNYYNIFLEGKNVVIVGRSELVGKPLMNILINMNATVTLCHSKTIDLRNHTKNADILISATGKKYLIESDMVKKDAIIIDVGITRIEGKLYGDVDYDNVSKKVKYITPVPGGVGPMTVIMLMKNVIESFQKKKS